MRIFGRITIYGEYLMHTITHGLITKSTLYLANEQEKSFPIHQSYDIRKDKVADFLRKKSYTYDRIIRGNLPLGYGFSSSTILLYLNLSKKIDESTLRKLIMQADHEIHGFPPSGLDIEFCFQQSTGLFGKNEWIDTQINNFYHSIIIFPKCCNKTLPEIQFNILNNNLKPLSKLAEDLNSHIINHNKLNYQSLLEYSKILLNSNVYNGLVESFISTMLQNRIIAKGIGGLYDKAVLIIWESKEARDNHNIWHIIESLSPLQVFK